MTASASASTSPSTIQLPTPSPCPAPTTPPHAFSFVFGSVGPHFDSAKALQAAVNSCIEAGAQIIILSECSTQAARALLALTVVAQAMFNVTLVGNLLLLIRNGTTKVWQCRDASLVRASATLKVLKLRFTHVDKPDAVQHFLWPLVDTTVAADTARQVERDDVLQLTRHLVEEVHLFQRAAAPCCVIGVPPSLLTSAMRFLGTSVHAIKHADFNALATGLDASEKAQLLTLPPSPWMALVLPRRK